LQTNDLLTGRLVEVSLFSPDIEFSASVSLRLDMSCINKAAFTAKPKDTCYPGKHTVKISVRDKDNGSEIISHTFFVDVVDFAFDHVSRPLLSKASSVVLGSTSLLTYVLTTLHQIDTVLGLTSGTVAAILAGMLYTQFHYLYKRPLRSVDTL